MSEQQTTRDRLIATGLRALMSKGYDGVGIGPILTEAGVPKGSFYHYFASKDDFVIAILDAYDAHYRAIREQIFADGSLDPLSRLDAYFGVLEQELIDSFPAGGCLYGILSQSLSGRSPGLRDRLAQVFRSWQQGLAELIIEARAAGQLPDAVDPQAAAALAVDLYEGALVRGKAEGSLTPFIAFRARLPRLLRTA
ncbi:MAG TPA: TetR/AcrR family transcriptional regulator [Paenirhodobacter sp.]